MQTSLCGRHLNRPSSGLTDHQIAVLDALAHHQDGVYPGWVDFVCEQCLAVAAKTGWAGVRWYPNPWEADLSQKCHLTRAATNADLKRDRDRLLAQARKAAKNPHPNANLLAGHLWEQAMDFYPVTQRQTANLQRLLQQRGA